MSESLERVAARLGLASPGLLGQVFAHWEDLVGADVAAHAAPKSLRDGTLTITVDHPAWATSLRLLAGDLTRRISEGAGGETVTNVVVNVEGPGGRSSRKRPG